jgi:hypothetical protein
MHDLTSPVRPMQDNSGDAVQAPGARHGEVDQRALTVRQPGHLGGRLEAEHGAGASSQDGRPQYGGPARLAGEHGIDPAVEPLPVALPNP